MTISPHHVRLGAAMMGHRVWCYVSISPVPVIVCLFFWWPDDLFSLGFPSRHRPRTTQPPVSRRQTPRGGSEGVKRVSLSVSQHTLCDHSLHIQSCFHCFRICPSSTLSLCTHAVTCHCVVQITSTSASASALNQIRQIVIPESRPGTVVSAETEEAVPLARARSSAPEAAVI